MSDTLRQLIAKWRQEAGTLEANAERAKANIGVAGLSGFHAEYRRLAKLQNIMADELEAAFAAAPLVSPPGERTPPTPETDICEG